MTNFDLSKLQLLERSIHINSKYVVDNLRRSDGSINKTVVVKEHTCDSIAY